MQGLPVLQESITEDVVLVHRKMKFYEREILFVESKIIVLSLINQMGKGEQMNNIFDI